MLTEGERGTGNQAQIPTSATVRAQKAKEAMASPRHAVSIPIAITGTVIH